jgi:ABC-type sugar transport system ATPase subunit
MSGALEAALKDLDESTEALLEADIEDVVAVCKALERRADAITKVAFLIDEQPQASDRGAVDRLGDALARGEQATRRALRMKQDATEEWTRLNQILHGLDSGRVPTEPQLDCAG